MIESPDIMAFKIVLVGDTNAGKSSICLRYIDFKLKDTFRATYFKNNQVKVLSKTTMQPFQLIPVY